MSEWADDVFEALVSAGVRQVAYVPDMGHKRLIEICNEDARVKAVLLTTEEEGVALLAGAWLGGEAGALLMQSSGVPTTARSRANSSSVTCSPASSRWNSPSSSRPLAPARQYQSCDSMASGSHSRSTASRVSAT